MTLNEIRIQITRDFAWYHPQNFQNKMEGMIKKKLSRTVEDIHPNSSDIKIGVSQNKSEHIANLKNPVRHEILLYLSCWWHFRLVNHYTRGGLNQMKSAKLNISDTDTAMNTLEIAGCYILSYSYLPKLHIICLK